MILIIVGIYVFRIKIVQTVYKYLYKDSLTYKENEYSNNYEFKYIKKTNDFTPSNKEELINILYTIIDSDTEEFVIFCEDEYATCNKDIDDIQNDNTTLQAINTFVHPYNSYQKISIGNTKFNIIILNIYKKYTKDEIDYIEKEVNRIEKEIITGDLSTKDKLLKFHDYVINYTMYVDSDLYTKANDLLKHKKARCSAYTDLMSIYISKLKLPNYKIISEDHIWNYLYLDEKWSHIDLTWDDPVLPDNKQILVHKFFLIDTNTLKEFGIDSHEFNKDVYIEAK